jgi:two-component sensor histidine kinase
MQKMPPAAPAGKRRAFLRDAAVVVGVNAVVALALLLVSLVVVPQATLAEGWLALGRHMAYSQAIGLSIFGLIEAFRLTLWWQRRPGLAALGLVTVVAIPLGYALGVVMASALLGVPVLVPVSWTPAMGMVVLVTVLASAIAVMLLTQRDRLEAERLRAENADVRAASARLQLLQQQIEPHMLFNTLANAHALVDEDPVRAQALLEALSELLHASMQAGEQPLVPLRQEVALLEHYLRLMAIRMGPRLKHAVALPADLAQARLPPLSLQPLVENAIQHGIDPQVGGGSIRVTVRREGDRVVVDVADDGVGLQGADPFAAGRIGLANVRQRLAYAFGERASLQLADNPPRGVRATLTFPFEKDPS